MAPVDTPKQSTAFLRCIIPKKRKELLLCIFRSRYEMLHKALDFSAIGRCCLGDRFPRTENPTFILSQSPYLADLFISALLDINKISFTGTNGIQVALIYTQKLCITHPRTSLFIYSFSNICTVKMLKQISHDPIKSVHPRVQINIHTPHLIESLSRDK